MKFSKNSGNETKIKTSLLHYFHLQENNFVYIFPVRTSDMALSLLVNEQYLERLKERSQAMFYFGDKQNVISYYCINTSATRY